MLLTEQEISEILSFPWEKTVDFVRRVEARIEEKLKAQTPVGSVYRNVVTGDFELLAYDDANHPKGTYSDIYTDPLPPDDVVRDAERLDWIQANCRCDPMMDGQHKWWPTNFNKCLTGPSIREAIDAAMKEMK